MPINYRNGVPGLFTDIGKTLTATSLGLQGKDPSGVFEDDDPLTPEQILHQAQLLDFAGQPQKAQDFVNQQLGLDKIVGEDSNAVIKDTDTIKTLEGSENINKVKEIELPKRASRYISDSLKISGTTLKNLDSAYEQKIQDRAVDESVKLVLESVKGDTNFRKIVSLFSGVVGRQRAKGIAQKEIIQDFNKVLGFPLVKSSDDGLGFVEGAIGLTAAKFKNEKAAPVAALEGQVTETVFALNSILTGQNRVIKGITEQIKGTISGGFDPSTFVADKTAQSITNAFMLRKALNEANLTPQKLRKMSDVEFNTLDAGELIDSVTITPAEEEVLELIISNILNTPPAESRDLPKLNQNDVEGVKEKGTFSIEGVSSDEVPNLSQEELQRLAK